ncbi:MAG: c-type cytochrome biogenesis protein CcmI [Betaproteobacteria bacterium]|jgi:cytochrome c-type biogenesis protein CcmH|nr:c-type cytochrome biogenesis protein CcmI [Rhodocyclaceae bacterium]MCA3133106.1 c-type cytochrome biogenesis protein CcmI [Rhodocyclaceae bacterium]MCA3141815.1 c-type cytochrome biogenesis protein CcmI [Rhodocyclaceae bacterium]MCA3144723.1 c-type cytochrome biogenesis protein CcmI [Rhodocyclaceae bacterium]MCE2896697.1 c-type cytochrome biogenesis protein CcmI [Betaproteobacteria bacterium]
MIVFVAAAALLSLAALALLLPPLLRGPRVPGLTAQGSNLAVLRDQLRELDADLARGILGPDQHAAARAELERRVLEEAEGAPARTGQPRPGGRLLALALALALPAAAAALYAWLGNPAALDPVKRMGMTVEEADNRRKMIELANKLALRMQEKPDDSRGWVMLGRAWQSVGRFPDSVRAYERAVSLAPEDDEVLLEYAEAAALAQDGRLEGKPLLAVSQVLKRQPSNQKALAIAGSAALQNNDWKQAIALLERLRRLVPGDTDFSKAVEAGIAEARAELSKPAPGNSVAAGASMAGRVELSAALAGRAAPDDTVFIFARAAEGPRMPLAIARKRVRDLPAAFTLDDSMAMAPGMNLSAFPKVVVGARISKSGNAASQSGDLEGSSAPMAPGASGVVVVIDRVLP